MAVNPLALLGGVGVVALGVVGGLYVTGSASAVTIPEWRSVENDANATTEYGTGTYGNTYKRFLVGVGEAAQNKTPASNDAWWEWAFNNRYLSEKANTKGKFSGLSDKDKLKEMCKAAYKDKLSDSSNDGKIKATLSTTPTEEYKESDIWLFCSSGGTKMKTLKDVESEKNSYDTNSSYAKQSGYDAKLVSVTDAGSDWFWGLKEKEFFEASQNPADSTKTNSKFNKLWTDEKKQEYKNKPKTRMVRDLCKTSYNTVVPTASDNAEEYPKSDVGKFCTLEGTTLS